VVAPPAAPPLLLLLEWGGENDDEATAFDDTRGMGMGSCEAGASTGAEGLLLRALWCDPPPPWTPAC
jgi:hypothetical protein